MLSSIEPRLDRYVPPSLAQNRETQRRARMFVVSHFFGAPLGFIVTLYLYLIDPAPSWVLWTIVAGIAGFFVYPFALRETGKFNLLSWTLPRRMRESLFSRMKPSICAPS